MTKVLLAMSGGVDSSVAAKVLINAGYKVAGATFRLFTNEDICISDKTKGCCSLSDVEDARNVAYSLGLDHFVFNYSVQFGKEVIGRFVETYLSGGTPNPCIDCNRFIKFNKFLNRATLLGYDYISTGHYAGIKHDKPSGRYLLVRAKDLNKDQTYMLYGMTQYQLSKTIFPLNDFLKEDVRVLAKQNNYINASKPDSQDICFVRNGDYAAFIEDYTGKRMCQGSFIDENGKLIGKHKGIHRYTIGQRKGLEISLGKPVYVTDKDIKNNIVTLGEEKSLYSKRLTASDLNFITFDILKNDLKVTAKTRYRQKDTSATVIPLDENRVIVEFDIPQRAITSGQAVVFYDGDIVVGGGTII